MKKDETISEAKKRCLRFFFFFLPFFPLGWRAARRVETKIARRAHHPSISLLPKKIRECREYREKRGTGRKNVSRTGQNRL